MIKKNSKPSKNKEVKAEEPNKEELVTLLKKYFI